MWETLATMTAKEAAGVAAGCPRCPGGRAGGHVGRGRAGAANGGGRRP